jgi:hypothetical protein
LNEASQSSKPFALSPQSAARAEATPNIAAPAIANINPFKSRRISALQFIVFDS